MLRHAFQPKRVIFLSDVEDVFDQPPSNPEAKLLPVVKVKQDGGLSLPIATTNRRHDVTGGILTKLKAAASMVTESEGQTTVFVCRVNSLGASNAFIYGDLRGEAGTEITSER